MSIILNAQLLQFRHFLPSDTHLLLQKAGKRHINSALINEQPIKLYLATLPTQL
jgi:hypothetical protein